MPIYFAPNQTETHAGEYDIPVVGHPDWPGTSCAGNCPDRADCECVHSITYHRAVNNTRLVYAGGYCHAPSRISIELYHNLTGTPKLWCRQLPKYSKVTSQRTSGMKLAM